MHTYLVFCRQGLLWLISVLKTSASYAGHRGYYTCSVHSPKIDECEHSSIPAHYAIYEKSNKQVLHTMLLNLMDNYIQMFSTYCNLKGVILDQFCQEYI